MNKAVTLRLDINSEVFLVDTYLNGNIIINKRVQNFKEVRSQQGTITKEKFRVSLSDTLIDAVGDLSDLTQSPKVDIRKSIKGSIVISGQTIYEGSFQILNIYDNPKEVELIFQGNETAIKQETKAILLKDLFDGETIPYNSSSIKDYLNGSITDGYMYGVIDYGQNFTGTGGGGTIIDDPLDPVFTYDFKPLVSLKKVIDLLESVEGIVIDFDSSIKDEFLSQYIPLHNNENTYPVIDKSPANDTGNFESNVDRSTVAVDIISGTINLVGDTTYNYNTTVFNTTSYTATNQGDHQFETNLDFNLAMASPFPTYVTVSLLFKYSINGGADVIYKTIFQNAPSTSFTRNINESYTIYLNAADVVTWSIDYIQSKTGANTLTTTYTVNSGAKVSCLSSPQFTLNANVLVAENFIEGMNVWDHCIKTIINQVNGIIDKTDNGYIITPWVDWIEGGDSIDLNDKKENGQRVKIEPPSTTGAKKIKFENLEDEDFYNKAYKTEIGDTYGNLKIDDTGIDFASNTVTVSLPYSSTPIAPVNNTNLVIPKFINDEGNIIETNPRLLKLNGYVPFILPIRDAYSTTVSTTSSVPYFGHWESLQGGFDTKDYNFGQSLTYFASSGYPNNNLYKRFWEAYILETYGINSRKLTIKANLNQWEVINLKMNEKILYKNNEYRLLKISGADLTNPNSVQTLEIALRKEIQNIDIAPFYPYNVLNTVVQWKDSATNDDLGDASSEPSADVKESTKAYGYYYDSSNNTAIQSGKILVT